MQGRSGIRPGNHTVGITFEDDTVYGHGPGHDVHLIRLDDGTSVEEVNGWMDSMDVGADGLYADDGALTSTASEPAPETFLGAVQDIQPPLPETAYFHVQLKPGDCARVAEVPDADGKSMLQTSPCPSTPNREADRSAARAWAREDTETFRNLPGIEQVIFAILAEREGDTGLLDRTQGSDADVVPRDPRKLREPRSRGALMDGPGWSG